MSTIVAAYDEFNPSYGQWASCDDLASIEASDARASNCNYANSNASFGKPSLLFRTLGKLNNTYESTESLTSIGGSSPSLLKAFEDAIVQQRESSNNLAALAAPEHAHAETPLGKFFASLERFLNNFTSPLLDEGSAQDDNDELQNHVPKFC